MKLLVVALSFLLCSNAFSASVFNVLEDNSNNGQSLSYSLLGDSITGKRGATTFSFQTSTGLLTLPQLGQSTSINSIPVVHANEKTFVVAALSSAIALNKSMIALMNPVGSSVVLKIRKISVVNVQTTAVTGVIAQFDARRITSLTGGTAITPLPFDSIDTIGAGITCSTTGTVGGESATPLLRVLWSSDEWGPGTLDEEGLEHAFQETTPFYLQRDYTKPITLRAGEGITIKQITNSTQGSFDITILFTQE